MISSCISHHGDIYYIIKNPLRFNYDYEILAKVYDNDKCTGTPLDEVKDSIRTYYNKDDLAKKSELNEIADKIGNTEYCNTDTNGNYNVLYGSNMFAKIAYSQVGYCGKKYSTDYKGPCWVGSQPGNYHKYGSSITSDKANIEFINWVAKKAGLKNFSLSTRIKDFVEWLCEQEDKNKIYKDTSKLQVGDRAVELVSEVPNEEFWVGVVIHVPGLDGM